MFKKVDKSTAQVTSMSDRQYEALGRNIEAVVTSGYFSRFKLYKISFFRGLFFGFGSVLGASILVAVVIWFLSLFSEIPVIGRLVEVIQNSVQ